MEKIEEIYNEYALTIYKFLLSLTQNKELAEELTQETFYQAVKSVNSFKGDSKVSVWLCQIAKHCWYNYLRKNKLIKSNNINDFEPFSSGVEDLIILKADKRDLLSLIHSLPYDKREIVYLRL